MTGRKFQSAALVGKVEQSSVSTLHEGTTTYKDATITRQSKSKKTVITSGTKALKDKKETRMAKRKEEKKKSMELSDLSSIHAEASENDEEHVHNHRHSSREDRLENIVQKMINLQHEEKEALLKDSITSCDLKAKYKSVLNSISIDEVKEMLANAVRENFELKQELLKRDTKFLELQLDQINNNLRKRRPRRQGTRTPSKLEICQVLEEAAVIEKDLKVRLAKTEIDLIERSNILREVGTRMVLLEEKCEQLEAENIFLRKTHENCIKSLRAKNDVLERRCAKTDARRKLERAGLSEEIRECKTLLKSLTQNVNKCAKLYTDARMELKKRHVKSGDLSFELHVENEPPHTKSKQDRLTNWFVRTNPKVVQKAMSVWTEYLQRQVNNLEEKGIRTKAINTDKSEETMQFLYANQKNSNCTNKKSERSAFSSDEEESFFIGASPYAQSGKIDSYQDVPPSPTWTRICQRTGLKPNLQEVSVTENDSDN